MANSLNRAQVIGNLTRDPELRQTPGGQSVATIGVATNRKWKDQAGAIQEEVEYHNAVLWGRLAEIAGQYLKKGKKVYVEGRLKTRMWEDPDGKKNYKTEIVVENLVMLDRAEGGGGGSYSSDRGDDAVQHSPASSPAPASSSASRSEDIQIDDLPF